jgi:cytochrome P450
MALYRSFGPDVPVDAINQHGRDAFAEIARCVGRLAQAMKSGADAAAGPSVLRYLVESGSDDETALGNLIYMFEPAHFDVYSLWHWVLQHMAEHPHVADRIAEALHSTPADAGPLVQAAVLETLRLAQSEILYREAKSDGTFDGLFFPKGGIVRVCLWEGHKDERTFPEPFAFRPDRFQGRPFEIDEFSPFGLDKHRCIAAEVTVSLTALFLEELLTDFSCELADAGPAELGTYHWEPNAQSKISLSARPSLNPS